MKTQLSLFYFTFLAFIFQSYAQSNLFLDNSYPVEVMVMDFFDDPNINISNVSSTGNINSIAFFDAAGTDLGLDAGIVFCNGRIDSIVGPNDRDRTGSPLNIDGDADIDSMSTDQISYDAIAIEFDMTIVSSDTSFIVDTIFMPDTMIVIDTILLPDTLDFNYVFGSEEYPEFVNTEFNDAFAFFISGPGINGNFSNNAENISIIPDSSMGTDTSYMLLPVAIDNVNDSTNNHFFVSGGDSLNIEYDGFTTPLPARFIAQPNATYHIKMVVADRGDAIYDSGIFLSFNSLGQNGVLTPPTSFQISTNNPETNTVEFTNDSRYARSWSWNFGNGVTSMERNPGPITYSTPGTYTVSLTTENYCCTETFSTEVQVGVSSVQDLNDFPIKLYPNPVARNLNLDFDQVADIQKIEILSLLMKLTSAA